MHRPQPELNERRLRGERMIMTRVGFGVLALVIGAARPALSQQRCSVLLSGEWKLQFSSGAMVHQATLMMNGCTGEMKVAFYNQSTRQREEITEGVSLNQTARGIMIQGFNPVYSGTSTRHPSYLPDNLLYAVSPEGEVTFQNCDSQNCSPVDILSESQGVHVLLRNDCDEAIDVALLYQTPVKKWMRRGWWVVESHDVRETDVWTTNRYVYSFAQSATHEWNGDDSQGSVRRTVVQDAFDREDSAILSGNGLATVSFRRWVLDLTGETRTLRFSCD